MLSCKAIPSPEPTSAAGKERQVRDETRPTSPIDAVCGKYHVISPFLTSADYAFHMLQGTCMHNQRPTAGRCLSGYAKSPARGVQCDQATDAGHHQPARGSRTDRPNNSFAFTRLISFRHYSVYLVIWPNIHFNLQPLSGGKVQLGNHCAYGTHGPARHPPVHVQHLDPSNPSVNQ